MNRRKFLTVTGLSTAFLAVPAVGINSNAFFSNAISGILKKEFPYLNIEESEMRKFSTDFIKYTERFPFTYTQKLRAQIFSDYLRKPGSSNSKITEDLAKNFLLSTDFFLNKMDENRQIKYVGLFDSYQRPCSNPFSHLYYHKNNKQT